jgi:hypothetical protein
MVDRLFIGERDLPAMLIGAECFNQVSITVYFISTHLKVMTYSLYDPFTCFAVSIGVESL